jgi:hypothetical protein
MAKKIELRVAEDLVILGERAEVPSLQRMKFTSGSGRIATGFGWRQLRIACPELS